MVKFVLLGNGGVGKTTIRKVYLGEGFSESYKMTIGADLSVLRQGNMIMQIYDLAGQTGYRLIRSSYYFGAQGAILVFAVDRRDSMNDMEHWLHELYSQVSLEVPVVVVGNKVDLRESIPNCVTREEAEIKVGELQEKYPAIVTYIETSAKEELNVDIIFEKLIHHILNPTA
jgi:small GTP-binding protein